MIRERVRMIPGRPNREHLKKKEGKKMLESIVGPDGRKPFKRLNQGRRKRAFKIKRMASWPLMAPITHCLTIICVSKIRNLFHSESGEFFQLQCFTCSFFFFFNILQFLYHALFSCYPYCFYIALCLKVGIFNCLVVSD